MRALGLSSLVAAFFLQVATPVFAQNVENPLAAREAQVPKVVSWLQTQGVKLTFLGDEGGFRGYLGESANGKMQTFYVSPDGGHVVAGVLFKVGGTNVTGIQIGEMRSRFENAAKGILDATVGDAAVSKTDVSNSKNSTSAPTAQVPPAEKSPAVAAPAQVSPGPAPIPAKPEATDSTTLDKTSSLSVPPPSGPIPGEMGNRSDLWISKINRADFLNAAEKAPFFEVGAVSARPVLWMVADPQCIHCHKAWDRISQLVYAKRLRVRVILIAGLQGSEPKAREILSRPIPARAWLDSNAGTNVEMITDKNSPEWMTASGYLSRNMELTKKFGVDRTPFLAYVGQNGAFYSALGLPSDLDAFLASSGAL